MLAVGKTNILALAGRNSAMEIWCRQCGYRQAGLFSLHSGRDQGIFDDKSLPSSLKDAVYF